MMFFLGLGQERVPLGAEAAAVLFLIWDDVKRVRVPAEMMLR